MPKPDKYDWTYKTITEEEWHRRIAGAKKDFYEKTAHVPRKATEEDFIKVTPMVFDWKTWLTQLREEDKEQLLIAILEHLEKK